MAKRSSQDIRNKKSRSHKTKKRIAIKKAMLASRVNIHARRKRK